jgi:AcrR family transcriptional regulator
MPRIVDTAARRDALLDRAFELFATRGYAALSMRDLAKALGVTTGALYHYFPSKEAMFEAAVRRRAAADVAEATGGLDPRATDAERLAALMSTLVRRFSALQDTLRAVLDFHAQRPEPDARAFIDDVIASYRAPLVAVFGEPLGAVALSLMLGALTQQLLSPGSVDVRAHLDALAGWRRSER